MDGWMDGWMDGGGMGWKLWPWPWAAPWIAKSKERWMDGWMGMGTVAKQQNPSRIQAQGVAHWFADQGPFQHLRTSYKSKEMDGWMDGWMDGSGIGWNVEALAAALSNTVDSATETPPRARLRNSSRTPAGFTPKGWPIGLRTKGRCSTFEPAKSKER